MRSKLKLAKYACYTSNVAMAAVANLSPLLFITFHELYDISYTLLGLLVLVNFCTQLAVDLVFSFFSQLFPLHRTVRMMPLLTVLGMLLYALLPLFFPAYAYLFLLLGTVVFSASAGLCEVLISPVIAALPSDDPERDMSRAHSVYAWGVAAVVLVSTVWLKLLGRESWHYLALFWTVIPLTAFVLFALCELPPLQSGASEADRRIPGVRGILPLCVACIFLGGAAENTMTQWCSGYLETALQIPKLWGDLFGVAVFAVMLGLGRTLYARYGKRIEGCLLFGFLGAACCYVVAAVSQHTVVGLVACALTGFCVSMLWPGTLIYTAELLPQTGVAVYALLAAGGDLGGSLAPQMLGSMTDAVAAAGWSMGGLTPEQFGLKLGMLTAASFPVLGIVVVLLLRRRAREVRREKEDQK